MLPLALPVAMSAIKALVKFRGRVDDILSLRAATAELPFLLPPAPTNDAPHIEDMRSFFKSDAGRLVLELHASAAMFEAFDADPLNNQGFRVKLCRLYYQAVDVQPEPLGPGEPLPDRGPGAEERLAYFLVASHRLSRNPAITRVLLATADTLLEVAGENAGLFVSDPRLRPVVETLLQEFAGRVDFDDCAAQDLFKKLLSAGVAAAVENAGPIAKPPALAALVGAMAELRKENGGEFIAGLLTEDGFLRLSSLFLTRALEDQPVARDVFAAMLKEAARAKFDPAAVLGVLEAGLVAGSAHAPALLGPTLADKPLLAELLRQVSGHVNRLGIQGLATGEVFRLVLETVVKDPAKLADAAGLEPWVAELVAASADLLRLDAKELGLQALRILAKHPDVGSAAKLLVDVLQTVGADGFTADDLIEIGDAALRRAVPDVARIALAPLLEAGLRELLTPEGRKRVLLGSLEAVARNPKTWKALRPGTLEALLDGLREDPTGLLSGDTLVDVLNRLLRMLARRGQSLVDKKIEPGTLKRVLVDALKAAEVELGYGLDADTLPAFLERLLEKYLKAPFAVDVAKMKKIVSAALKELG